MTHMAETAHATIPDHVPSQLVWAFDIVDGKDMRSHPFTATSRLHGNAPRVFWNPLDPYFGGAWVPTRAEDIRYVLDNPGLFSSVGQTQFAKFAGQSWSLLPLEIDPPEHAKYRGVLSRFFSPSAVRSLSGRIGERARSLIEAFGPAGECDFMAAFGRPYPVSIFLELMGLPLEHTDMFMAWEHDLLHNYDMEKRGQAIAEVGAYLRDLAEQRKLQPTDDLTSAVVTSIIDGREMTADEILGTLFVLFMGGLDTVLSTLGLFVLHLAEHPDQQERLRREPQRIEKAIDELMRRYSTVSVNRQCTRDLELGGAAIKAGDWLSLTLSLGSLDPHVFDDPLAVDFDRGATRHFGFSFGTHFCLGSHLARQELVIALRELLGRLPLWQVKAGHEPVLRGGGVYGVDTLPLSWAESAAPAGQAAPAER